MYNFIMNNAASIQTILTIVNVFLVTLFFVSENLSRWGKKVKIRYSIGSKNPLDVHLFRNLTITNCKAISLGIIEIEAIFRYKKDIFICSIWKEKASPLIINGFSVVSINQPDVSFYELCENIIDISEFINCSDIEFHLTTTTGVINYKVKKRISLGKRLKSYIRWLRNTILRKKIYTITSCCNSYNGVVYSPKYKYAVHFKFYNKVCWGLLDLNNRYFHSDELLLKLDSLSGNKNKLEEELKNIFSHIQGAEYLFVKDLQEEYFLTPEFMPFKMDTINQDLNLKTDKRLSNHLKQWKQI